MNKTSSFISWTGMCIKKRKIQIEGFFKENVWLPRILVVRQCFISLVMTCLDRGTSLNFHFHVPLIKTLFQFSCQSFRNQVQLPEPGRNKLQNYPPFHQSPEILLASCCKRMKFTESRYQGAFSWIIWRFTLASIGSLYGEP